MARDDLSNFLTVVVGMASHRPSTLEDIMTTLRSLAGDKGESLQAFWNRHWRAVPARLRRLVEKGLLAKAFVKGRNYFIPGEAVAEAAKQFDLHDPTARLIAADWLEERGQEEIAGLLRQAKRWAFGDGR